MIKRHTNRLVVIMGEGRETEYNYFVGFRNAFQEELKATETSVRVLKGKGGSTLSIVKHAVREKKGSGLNPKRGDRVYLVLDTEGEDRAAELPVAEKLAEKNGIEIVYSCPSIEYWFLCHFQNVPRGHFKDCAAVEAALRRPGKWESICKAEYDKADEGVFSRLSHLLADARKQALEIDLQRLRSKVEVRRANPSSQIYELLAILIGVKSGEKCPISGTWKLIGGSGVTRELAKGDEMPPHQNKAVTWQPF